MFLGGIEWGIIFKGDHTKMLNKAMFCKNEIALFQQMRHLPRHPTHGAADPTKAETHVGPFLDHFYMGPNKGRFKWALAGY